MVYKVYTLYMYQVYIGMIFNSQNDMAFVPHPIFDILLESHIVAEY